MVRFTTIGFLCSEKYLVVTILFPYSKKHFVVTTAVTTNFGVSKQ